MAEYDEFIDWLKKQPPETPYQYRNACTCLAARFLESKGDPAYHHVWRQTRIFSVFKDPNGAYIEITCYNTKGVEFSLFSKEYFADRMYGKALEAAKRYEARHARRV